MMKLTLGFLVLLADFAVCLRSRIPFKLEPEALLKRGAILKRQTSSTDPIRVLPQSFCRPTPIPIKVPCDPLHAFPTHVTLMRCMGGTFGFAMECVAAVEEKFILNATHVYSRMPILCRMTNHTNCVAKCKPNTCNIATQYLDPYSCQCYCRHHPDVCLQQGQVLDPKSCKCVCKSLPIACVGEEAIKVWSDKSCQCECRDQIKRKCLSDNKKVPRPDTCVCVCPLKNCPKGQVVDQTDCKCASPSI
ncbi:vascular endothelial growth factor A-A-like [Dendronephthya gigantea]|uniref:vascular endothelial growth factor A-A-like n=1 Tax=Dendronephthya gigantea TaxID=151771 RepID=UPI001069E830|nr:vascular endothelial growth factor A-A-like [Dendronephthya gigantea]